MRKLDLTTPEQRALFGELDPVPVCFLQLVGKRYPRADTIIAVDHSSASHMHSAFPISRVKDRGMLVQ